MDSVLGDNQSLGIAIVHPYKKGISGPLNFDSAHHLVCVSIVLRRPGTASSSGALIRRRYRCIKDVFFSSLLCSPASKWPENLIQ